MSNVLIPKSDGCKLQTVTPYHAGKDHGRKQPMTELEAHPSPPINPKLTKVQAKKKNRKAKTKLDVGGEATRSSRCASGLGFVQRQE